VPKTNFQDLNNISFSLKRNDELVQSGNTQNMLWRIDELIAYVSQFFTLKIGDIIFTGTPAGVGPVQADDMLTGFIENEEFFKIKVK
jgi:2-keto-4-pentenoate hydratase/2-oxohepta-3-ene-1,7-dioic acid hydratase in catechol pathway